MKSTCKYEIFNKCSKELFKFVMKQEPDNLKIKTIYQSYKVIKSINKKFVHKFYDTIVFSIYEQQIREKNEAYFLDPDFIMVGWENLFKTIQESWVLLNDDTKNIIWIKLIHLADLNIICKQINYLN